MTIVDTELDIIQRLDFDAKLPCDGCDEHPAKWRMTFTCCVRPPRLICDECRERLIEFFNSPVAMFKVCNACGKTAGPETAVFEPIKGEP